MENEIFGSSLSDLPVKTFTMGAVIAQHANVWFMHYLKIDAANYLQSK